MRHSGRILGAFPPRSYYNLFDLQILSLAGKRDAKCHNALLKNYCEIIESP